MDLCRSMGNFYPRSPCGERLRRQRARRGPQHFYPRSPCGERHRTRRAVSYVTAYFYPRSPCGERLGIVCRNDFRCKFLSTLSLRRATESNRVDNVQDFVFLSTLSLRRATTVNFNVPPGLSLFLSTLSLRRATHLTGIHGKVIVISIHALLAESDFLFLTIPILSYSISIHALLAESDSKSAQNSGALLRI